MFIEIRIIKEQMTFGTYMISKIIISPLIILALFSTNVFAQRSDTMKLRTDPQQKLDVQYRLFKTENMWSFLLLDTKDGRVWHCFFSASDKGSIGRIPINANSLLDDKSTYIGRFTLYPTDNIWNFILLDQDDGRTWQIQFSADGKDNLIIPMKDLRYIQKDTSVKGIDDIEKLSCKDKCMKMYDNKELQSGTTLNDCFKILCNE